MPNDEAVRLVTETAYGISLVVDTCIYRDRVVKKAAYKFTDRFHILIRRVNPTQVNVLLKSKIPGSDIHGAAGEFCNELLDQELREVVAGETEAIRNLLLAQAFSKTTLIEAEFDSADYRDDPKRISNLDSPSRANDHPP